MNWRELLGTAIREVEGSYAKGIKAPLEAQPAPFLHLLHINSDCAESVFCPDVQADTAAAQAALALVNRAGARLVAA